MHEEPIWVRDDVVLAVHRRQIAEHGGMDGVRDISLLQSALSKPKNLFFYEENIRLERLATSYAYGIARNHPFLDGNKRTAFVVCRLFLKLNGIELNASAEAKYTTFIHLAEGSLSEAALTDWIQEHSTPYRS